MQTVLIYNVMTAVTSLFLPDMKAQINNNSGNSMMALAFLNAYPLWFSFSLTPHSSDFQQS